MRYRYLVQITGLALTALMLSCTTTQQNRAKDHHALGTGPHGQAPTPGTFRDAVSAQ